MVIFFGILLSSTAFHPTTIARPLLRLRAKIIPEFSRPVDVTNILNRGGRLVETFAATDDELKEVTKRIQVSNIEDMVGTVVVFKASDDVVKVNGNVSATVTQPCVVTSKPISAKVDAQFRIILQDTDPDFIEQDSDPYAEFEKKYAAQQEDDNDWGDLDVQDRVETSFLSSDRLCRAFDVSSFQGETIKNLSFFLDFFFNFLVFGFSDFFSFLHLNSFQNDSTSFLNSPGTNPIDFGTGGIHRHRRRG